MLTSKHHNLGVVLLVQYGVVGCDPAKAGVEIRFLVSQASHHLILTRYDATAYKSWREYQATYYTIGQINVPTVIVSSTRGVYLSL